MSFFGLFKKKHSKKQPLVDELHRAIEEGQKKRDIFFSNQRPENDDYGYELSNPIGTSGIDSSEKYLSSLRTENGNPLDWIRNGSYCLEEINGVKNVPVDYYDVYVHNTLNKVATLYICPYSHNSDAAPKKFFLSKEERQDEYKGNLYREVTNAGLSPDYYLEYRRLQLELKKKQEQEKEKVNAALTPEQFREDRRLKLESNRVLDELKNKQENS